VCSPAFIVHALERHLLLGPDPRVANEEVEPANSRFTVRKIESTFSDLPDHLLRKCLSPIPESRPDFVGVLRPAQIGDADIRRRARSNAVARPIPRDPPVTSAVRLRRSIMARPHTLGLILGTRYLLSPQSFPLTTPIPSSLSTNSHTTCSSRVHFPVRPVVRRTTRLGDALQGRPVKQGNHGDPDARARCREDWDSSAGAMESEDRTAGRVSTCRANTLEAWRLGGGGEEGGIGRQGKRRQAGRFC
jgi:hypothetical protein